MGNGERVKLKTMLPYWIEHSNHHSRELWDWGDKAAGIGETEAAKEMTQAARKMDEATRSLSLALRSLEKGGH